MYRIQWLVFIGFCVLSSTGSLHLRENIQVLAVLGCVGACCMRPGFSGWRIYGQDEALHVSRRVGFFTTSQPWRFE